MHIIPPALDTSRVPSPAKLNKITLLLKEYHPIAIQSTIKTHFNKLIQKKLTSYLDTLHQGLSKATQSSIASDVLNNREEYRIYIAKLMDLTDTLLLSINSQLPTSKDNKKTLSLLDVIDPIARNNQCDLTTAKQKLIVLHTQKFNTQVLRLTDEHLRKQREEIVEGKSLIAKTICLDLYHQLGLDDKPSYTAFELKKWTRRKSNETTHERNDNKSTFDIPYMVNTLLRQAMNHNEAAFELLLQCLNSIDTNWARHNESENNDKVTQYLITNKVIDKQQIPATSNKINRRGERKSKKYKRMNSHLIDVIKAAKKGSAQDQTRLGSMYECGRGVKRDLKKAAEWLTEAANQGHSQAQNNLGLMYIHGKGVKRDLKKAVEWLTEAANQGDPDAQNNLGLMYKHGQGVDKNFTIAAQWYTKAANQGHSQAQNNLGVLYCNGDDAFKDLRMAAYWYTKAANQGNLVALSNLALIHKNGEGIEPYSEIAAQWYTKAYEWCQRSAEQWYEAARASLSSLNTQGFFNSNNTGSTTSNNEEENKLELQ